MEELTRGDAPQMEETDEGARLQKALDEAIRQRDWALKQIERGALSARMDAVLGEKRFAHARLREDVLDEFAKAAADPANAGQSDEALLKALTDGRDYFATPAQPPRMARFSPIAQLDDRAQALRRAFGL